MFGTQSSLPTPTPDSDPNPDQAPRPPPREEFKHRSKRYKSSSKVMNLMDVDSDEYRDLGFDDLSLSESSKSFNGSTDGSTDELGRSGSNDELAHKKAGKKAEAESEAKSATSPQPPPLLFQLALLGSDNQTTVMSFLKPFDVYAYMTSPLSNLFRTLLTLDDDIWRRLCCSAPFNHNTRQEPQSLVSNGHFAKFGKWRGLYMNMFKCFEFLSQTTARNIARLNENSSAIVPDYVFLCKRDSKTKMEDAGSGSGSGRENKNAPLLAATRTKTRTRTTTLPVLDRIKIAPSSITARLFAAPANQTTTTNTSTTMALEHINKAFLLSPSRLPWTSTMYTIHNWLSFYFNVVGIQEACLSALPCLLEKDSQREDAMRIHLTDLVLKAMVRFPKVTTVNNAALHSLVFLARPLGSHEGTVYDSREHLQFSEFFESPRMEGKSGIAVILDSMKRFADDWRQQTMSCWSLVNISLIPKQKRLLIKLGGIQSVLNAMRHHPKNSDIQFRGLFALVNLSGANEGTSTTTEVENQFISQALGPNLVNVSEKFILNSLVPAILDVVVRNMKDFLAHVGMVRHAHLILFNLSRFSEYHEDILFRPYGSSCMNSLRETCQAYKTDQAIMQNAGETMHALKGSLQQSSGMAERYLIQKKEHEKLELEEKMAAVAEAQRQLGVLNSELNHQREQLEMSD